MPSVTGWTQFCHWEGNVLNICKSICKLDIATHKEVPQWIEEWFRNTFFKVWLIFIRKIKDSLVPDTYFGERKQEELELVDGYHAQCFHRTETSKTEQQRREYCASGP